MDILDEMRKSKLSPKVFLKVNYSFKFKGSWASHTQAWRRWVSQ